MSNLPITWQDKKNSPELEAYLAQFGRQFYIDAKEANQVRDAINELAERTPQTTPTTPYLTLKFTGIRGHQNGIPNTGPEELPGDIYEGWKDATTYWVRARWNGGDRANRANYTPIVEAEL